MVKPLAPVQRSSARDISVAGFSIFRLVRAQENAAAGEKNGRDGVHVELNIKARMAKA
jgi:hypothetical protein